MPMQRRVPAMRLRSHILALNICLCVFSPNLAWALPGFDPLCTPVNVTHIDQQKQQASLILGNYQVPIVKGWKLTSFTGHPLSAITYGTTAGGCDIQVKVTFFQTPRGAQPASRERLMQDNARMDRSIRDSVKQSGGTLQTLSSVPIRYQKHPGLVIHMRTIERGSLMDTRILKFVTGNDECWVSVYVRGARETADAKSRADRAWNMLKDGIKHL